MPGPSAGEHSVMVWDDTDTDYWLAKEGEVAKELVDLSGCGVVIGSRCYDKGWTDDPRIFARKGAAEALVTAKNNLPSGLNIKVFDGWRPWKYQERIAAAAYRKIRSYHPDWTDDDVRAYQWKMAPPARIVPRFASHRYGGAFDVTLVDENGDECDMGVPVGYNGGPETQLLWYHLLTNPDAKARAIKSNRSVLITAMSTAGFQPYLEEFWHWNYLRDVEAASRETTGNV